MKLGRPRPLFWNDRKLTEYASTGLITGVALGALGIVASPSLRESWMDAGIVFVGTVVAWLVVAVLVWLFRSRNVDR
jgi:hypothetical protein